MNMKRFLSLLLALSLLLTCAAAFAEAATDATEPAADAAPAEPVLLVTVNGTEITDQNDVLQYYTSYYQYMYSMYGYDVTDPTLARVIKAGTLDFTILYELTMQKAAELGMDQFTEEELTKLQEDAQADWEEYVTEVMSSNGLADDASDADKAAARVTAIAQIEAEGYTEAEYVANVLENMKRSEIQNRVYHSIIKDVTVSDEEVEKYFMDLVTEDRERALADPEGYVSDYEFYSYYGAMYPGYVDPVYYIPEGYRTVNHILLKPDEELLSTWKGLAARLEEQNAPEETVAPDAEATAAPETTEEPVTQEAVDAAAQAIVDSLQPKIDEIQKKLAEGTSFEDLIAEYGEDPGMSTEERRKAGYQVHASSVLFDPAFREGAMKLEKAGDVSEPILGSSGIHIIQYLADVPAGQVELTEAMKQEFHDNLLSEKQNEVFTAAREEWRSAANIVYTAEGDAWMAIMKELAAEEDATGAESTETETTETETTEKAEETPAN